MHTLPTTSEIISPYVSSPPILKLLPLLSKPNIFSIFLIGVTLSRKTLRTTIATIPAIKSFDRFPVPSATSCCRVSDLCLSRWRLTKQVVTRMSARLTRAGHYLLSLTALVKGRRLSRRSLLPVVKKFNSFLSYPWRSVVKPPSSFPLFGSEYFRYEA